MAPRNEKLGDSLQIVNEMTESVVNTQNTPRAPSIDDGRLSNVAPFSAAIVPQTTGDSGYISKDVDLIGWYKGDVGEKHKDVFGRAHQIFNTPAPPSGQSLIAASTLGTAERGKSSNPLFVLIRETKAKILALDRRHQLNRQLFDQAFGGHQPVNAYQAVNDYKPVKNYGSVYSKEYGEGYSEDHAPDLNLTDKEQETTNIELALQCSRQEVGGGGAGGGQPVKSRRRSQLTRTETRGRREYEEGDEEEDWELNRAMDDSRQTFKELVDDFQGGCQPVNSLPASEPYDCDMGY